jgi:uncharacterized protein with GYD domain
MLDDLAREAEAAIVMPRRLPRTGTRRQADNAVGWAERLMPPVVTGAVVAAIGLAPKRHEATKALVTKLGGRLVCAYVTTGQYDVALVVEMPNRDAMTQLAVAITSSGNACTTTVRAFSPEEFGKLAADAPTMT